MKYLNLLLIVFVSLAVSCTKEKTDYEAEFKNVTEEEIGLEQVASFAIGKYELEMETLGGTLCKGYNEIFLKVKDPSSKEIIKDVSISLLPVVTDKEGNSISCPHSQDWVYDEEKGFYAGNVVFTEESSANAEWTLHFKINRKYIPSQKELSLTVGKQKNMNLNMTIFTGTDGEKYVVALIAPQKPRVAENELIAGIYKYNRPEENSSSDPPGPSQFSYTEVQDYILKLDPRMPEASMGNHSSPNNVDLTQGKDGKYYGVVNYTMTGNWTLNFIMLNEKGKIIKGTEVPKDFTPGIEGVKSELHLDILF